MNQLPTLPNAHALAQQLLASLKQDRIELGKLRQNLQDERTALEKQQHDQLGRFAQQKDELTGRLDQRHAERVTLLQQNKLAVEADSWRPIIEHIEAQSRLPLTGLWNEVEEQLKECQALLQVNEKIVAHLQNNVSQLLNTLRGATSSGQTYGKSGKAETFSDTQTITSA